MQIRAVRFAKVALLTAAAAVIAILWATPNPPVARSGAPGETTCSTSSCHGGAGSAGVGVSSTSGMTNYTPGVNKRFTVTVSGSGGNAGFELTARPASNLAGGVAGNFIAGTGTQVGCLVGSACGAGNPQFIRSTSATATPATFAFDWTPPSGTEDITLYVAAAVGWRGTSAGATYLLKASTSGAPPTLSVAPGSLSFSYQIGGAAPAAQTLAIGGAATTYTAAASGGTWLSVSPTSGGASGSASVSVNTTGLAVGAYSGSVTVTAAGSTGSPITVPVALNVTAAATTLTVSPTSLAFAFQLGGSAPAAQSIAIGGPSLKYTVAASGGAWLSVSPASGATPGSASVSVNTAGLAAGTYTGTVTVTPAGTTGGARTVAVNLTVTNAASALQVTPKTLAFKCATGNTSPIPFVLNVASGATAFNYTAVASSGWLSVAPAKGATPGTLFVSIKPAGLAAGSYSASITITATNSAGSAQTVPVTLEVGSTGPNACPVD